jgi:cyclopropane-fatty-acyl-phospholipid synthase
MNSQAKKQDDSVKEMIESLLDQAGIQINGNQAFDIQVHNENLYQRILQEGSLGLGESYMDGWWDCDRLDIFFYKILRAKLDKKVPHNLKNIIRLAIAKFRNLQTKKRAWIVGEEHYDLGNDLFSLMLDPYMQYSCAYWKDTDRLEQAQENKLDLICRKLDLKPGMRVLDIGCGWGGLAEYAAKHYQVSVTGITISKEQQKLAMERCKGLDVEILLTDYREMRGLFDRVVSIGMFEHVGPKNYETYFKVVQRNLKSDGLFLLHTIGANTTMLNADPWTSKYIFPNGCLPSIENIAHASNEKLIMEDWHNFGADYDLTLSAWHERFLKNWPEIEANYSLRFKRMFTYYLNACAGAFRARDLQLWQIVFSPNGQEGGIRVAR